MKSLKSIFKRIFLLLIALVSVSVFLFAKNDAKLGQTEAITTYESDSLILTNLMNDTSTLESAYNLSKLYPLIVENQTSSSLCWLYSSLKALESSFMVQTGEYFNFSEVGMAYLNVFENGGSTSFDSMGNFESFVECYQENGLILESDFSDNEYQNLKIDDYDDYKFVKDFSTKEYNSMIHPYEICENSYFSSLSLQNKTLLIKKFIKNYGALFTGIEGGNGKGCFYFNDGAENDVYKIYQFYSYDRSSYLNAETYQALTGNHAICVVGWNDNIAFGSETGAFVAMNSWGLENGSMSFFYIPYSYSGVYEAFSGFVCDTTVNHDVKIEESASSSFTTDILTGSNTIKNFFCYDDTIWIKYKLNVSSLENVTIDISSGYAEYDGLFSTFYDNENKTIKVSLNASSGVFHGGYYTLSFYNSGSLLGKKSIYIYSGTEIGYFKINSTTLDSYTLNNAFANLDSSATLNLSSTISSGVYLIYFNLTNINNYYTIFNSASKEDWSNLSVTLSDASIVCSTNTSLETTASSYLIEHMFVKSLLDNANVYRIQIGYTNDVNLSYYENAMLRFKLTIQSPIYEDCARDYYFNIFISPRTNAATSNLNRIFYNLNGGENPKNAILKYPNYTNDAQMTAIALPVPTKVNANFLGWYLNKECTGDPISVLDTSKSGDIALFAKWGDITTNYFNISLTKIGITDYNGQTKDLSAAICYGDSVKVRLSFMKATALEGIYYTVYYYFYGINLVSDYLDLTQNYVDFNLNFPSLISGGHTYSVKVVVEIANSYIISEQKSISFSVAQKAVAFSFSNLSQTYDGTVRKPTVSMTSDFYVEDKVGKSESELYQLYCEKQARVVGSYTYKVNSISNSNYSFDKDASTCVLQITKREISLTWKSYNQTYDGKNHFPEYTLTNVVGEDVVKFEFTLSECKEAKSYTINIKPETISNLNYTVQAATDFQFEIKKAQIQIIMHNTTDRIQTKVGKRIVPTYSVVGNFFSYDDLNLTVSCEAITNAAAKSGKYTISCLVQNDNYEASVTRATYTLTDYYYVYYQLSNGTLYSERVEHGQTPVGVTKKQLDVPFFSVISYSDDFEITGNDLYVSVTVKDYTIEAYIAIAIIVFLIVLTIVYMKKRESKVR